MTLTPVIGLEVHARLATRTKIFCGCSNTYGDAPNTNVCPVCLGLPGTLPVLNARAVDLAVRLGSALGCRVASRSIFERKSYFYPDLPRNYQITQQDAPLCTGGGLEIGLPGARRFVELERIHLEEDAGKSVHDADGTRIDLNRAGTPLVEIVTRPVLCSADEAYAVLRELRRLVRALGVSDGDMEHGSLRCDANVSLRGEDDAQPGVRVELKNLNSLRGIRRGLDYEIARQSEMIARGEVVTPQTRGWDASRGETYFMRSKESSDDYRYIPEPDLPPLLVPAVVARALRDRLPELPAAREERYVTQLGLSPEVAATLTETTDVSDYFETVAHSLDDPRIAANWVAGEVLRLCGETGVRPGDLGVPPAALVDLLHRIAEGTLSHTAAKTVFAVMAAEGCGAEEVILRKGLGQITDRSVLAAEVARVVEDHPDQVARFRDGKTGVADWLVGRVMAATGGRADPVLCADLVRSYLAERLDQDAK